MTKTAGMLMLLLSSIIHADIPFPYAEPPLDKIAFQISAKQWVTTKTALLSINVNATLTNADLVKTRNEIMDTLNKIAKGDWHVTQFDRSQDSSGLEKLYVQAQVRMEQSNLTGIYQIAKDVSKPGSNYEIGGIEFKPSLEETQLVESQVREQLYQKANDELSRINKVYAGQNYTLNNLIFFPGDTLPPQILEKSYRQETMNTMVMASPAPAPSIAVSNELTLTALVLAASNRSLEK